ncbi:hypothetical protein VTO42DRAFT_3723 [Malbranchea cinnamomea]
MAFRLPNQTPSHQQPQQAHQYAVRSPSPSLSPISTSQAPFQYPEDDDSREWVLFSPTQDRSVTASTAGPLTHSTSTERTPRLSDFGSLGFGGRSSLDGHDDGDEEEDVDLLEAAEAEEVEEEEENNTELDSLDEGLHAFREPNAHASGEQDTAQLFHSEPALLPAHDGLGMFPASSINVQEQLWQHEQFNPNRRIGLGHRRLSSVHRHLEQLDRSQPRDLEHERWQRIEQWRMEQGRALLEEIEKENKRRRRNARNRRLRERPVPLPRLSTNEVMGDVSAEATSAAKGDDIPPAESEKKAAGQMEAQAEESFWRRITRKVIRDLMGLDDSLLSVILGESLVPIAEEGKKDEQTVADGHAKKRKVATILEPDLPDEMDEMLKSITSSHQDDTWWQEKLLNRIARELGMLVHQIYDNPGAFSAYTRTSSPSQDTAGLSSGHPNPAWASSNSRPNIPSRTPSFSSARDAISVHTPNFIPTLQTPASTGRHSSESGGPRGMGRSTADAVSSAPCVGSPSDSGEPASEISRPENDREYWERQLDVGVVFHYLWKRLAGKLPISTESSRADHRSHDPSQRAAIIRRNHPLVARAYELAHPQPPMRWQTTSPSTTASAQGAGTIASPIAYRRMRRSSSSCASQSTRISVSTKRTLASGSSRHYWDIGGSVGGSSAVLTVGGAGGSGLGSWGDV